MTKDLVAYIHGLKKYEFKIYFFNLFLFFSVKEGMYLNTKDFINEVKKTLDKKLNSVNGKDK
jgi:hypothetical protein